MRKTTIKFEYSEEKLMALESYLEKKDTDLDTELEDIIEKLYEKYVPSQVREFIEAKTELAIKKPRKPKVTIPTIVNENNSSNS